MSYYILCNMFRLQLKATVANSLDVAMYNKTLLLCIRQCVTLFY